jgi:hypothetical protein
MRIHVLLALLVLATACGELKSPTAPDPLGPIDPTATFTRVQNEVFTPSCANAGCHDPDIQQAGLVLTAGRAYANVVNQASTELPALRRVQPGDPDNSYLYRKLTGAGIVGERMPLIGSLDERRIALVRDWIRRGAPND